MQVKRVLRRTSRVPFASEWHEELTFFYYPFIIENFYWVLHFWLHTTSKVLARSVRSFPLPPPPPPSSRHTIFFFSSSRKMLTIEISNWSRLGQRQSGDVIAAVASHQHLRQQPKLKRIGPLDCSIRTRFFAPSNDPGRLCAMLPPLCAKLRAPVALASPTACPDCWNYGRDGTRPITASSLLPPVTR